MNPSVPLIRRFSSIPLHNQKSDIELMDLWAVSGRGERVDWQALRDLFRCVILADAGAGKTFELRAEASRLAERGLAAFFIRIEDIDESFGGAFEVGTAEAFERWLTGTEEAWFFLDSVDEVRLETPRAFETAIRAFATCVRDARQRAHVYISSRPYAWRAQADRALIEEFLPYDRLVGESTGEAEGPSKPNETEDNGAKSGLQLYRLALLDTDDIRIFAGHRGVANVDSLIGALERTDLFILAQLPFDLEDILAVWNETGSLNSRLAVLERGITRRLSPQAGASSTLSLDKALEGARRLAIATTLTGEANITMPGCEGGGIDPATVLDDWSRPQIRVLLDRGVFSDAIYSMVRFRHREVREMLAAQWLANALGNSTRRGEIEGVLFRELYGEVVIVPRTRPLLPWLILFDEAVRFRALKLAPEIIVEGGDPARLPLAVRRANLLDLVERIAAGDARGGDNSAVERIAQRDLSDDILALLDSHSGNDNVVFFLGRLIWQGAMVEAAARLAHIARDPARGIYARIVSARAVATTQGVDACKALWRDLNSEAKIPYRLLAELLDAAPTDVEAVGLLLASLEFIEPDNQFETMGLSRALHGLIDRLPLTSDRAPARPLVCLVEGLADLLAREPHVARRECKVSKANCWLMGPAMHAVERLIISRSSACFDLSALAVLAQVPALRHWGGDEDRGLKTKLHELIPRWAALNDFLFWHTVAMARASEDKPVDDDWTVSWIGHFWAFDVSSFDRTLEWITSREIHDDRSLALSRSFRTYAESGRPAAWRRRLWKAIEGDPILEAKLRMLMRPPPSPERDRWRLQERKLADQRRRRDKNDASDRAALIAHVQANPDDVREPQGLEPGQMTWVQAHLLRSIEGDGMRISRGAGAQWRKLIPEFGEEVAEAFRDGAMRHWRRYRPTLRSESGGSNTIPYALVFAMTGLEIESGDDRTGLAHLPKDEALHALRYATAELNGFPAWLEPLYRMHPKEGFEFFWGETRWELEHSGAEPIHYMLQNLVYHAPWLQGDLATPIYNWLFEHGSPNGDCLHYGRLVMVGGGIDAARLAALARYHFVDASTPDVQRASWLALWVENAPSDGLPALANHLASLAEPADAGFAEEFIVSLMGGSRSAGAGNAAWKNPEDLRALYVLMHRYIRTDEDLNRTNGGVYSPTMRDDAQDARDTLFNLLSAIPGEATYRQILMLADDHPEPSYRAHMRRRAHDRAVEDSDRDWSLSDVIALAAVPTAAGSGS